MTVTLTLFLFVSLVLTTTAAFAAVQITTRAEARAWIDRVFAENGCAMSLNDFRLRMRQDGVAPGPSDMAMPTIGTEKMIRERLILAETGVLSEEGGLEADPQDQTRAISTFGGCAE